MQTFCLEIFWIQVHMLGSSQESSSLHGLTNVAPYETLMNFPQKIQYTSISILLLLLLLALVYWDEIMIQLGVCR